MAEVFFYHLTRSPLDVTLATLLDKSLAAGWRVLVRGTDDARMRWLDDRLWVHPEEAFLPHGLDGDGTAADHPVLLTTTSDKVTAARKALVSVDGAEIDAQELAGLSRGMILFDGADDAALARARTQWRGLTGAGIKAKYWSEETGSWAMKAES